MSKAKAAAFPFGARIAIPSFPGVNRTRNDTDFNDVARHLGSAELRHQIEAVLTEAAPRLRRRGPYEAKKDGLYATRVTRDGTEHQRLTNFVAWVVAEREKRPLLDVGCRVFGYDNNGNLVEVTQ